MKKAGFIFIAIIFVAACAAVISVAPSDVAAQTYDPYMYGSYSGAGYSSYPDYSHSSYHYPGGSSSYYPDYYYQYPQYPQYPYGYPQYYPPYPYQPYYPQYPGYPSYPYKPNKLQATCRADMSIAYVDQPVTWRVYVYGGDGDYDYDWSGEEVRDRNVPVMTVEYDTTGTKAPKVTVKSDSKSVKVTCESIRVINNPYPWWPY